MENTLHRQTSARNSVVGGSLPVKSPYFHMADTRKEAAGRNTIHSLLMTNVNAIVVELYITPDPHPVVSFYDASTNVLIETQVLSMTMADVVSLGLNAAELAAIALYASGASYTILNTYWNVASSVPAVINSATRSIVTGTGATGFQVSATRNAFVNYNTTIASTASISGNASGVLVLEVAPTNSATAGDWVEISRFTNAQALSLAITLQSVQTLSSPLSGMVPAGYYAKIRSITSGTVTYTYNSGREILQ